MQSDNDSLARLIEDVEQAAAHGMCAYWGKSDRWNCKGCPAGLKDLNCSRVMYEDIARRLHALMPHDMDGREIEVGDTIESTFGTQVQVTDVMALPVNAHDGVVDQFPVSLLHLWRVMEPDSWERLEEDATMLPHDYLTAKDTSDKRYGTEALTAMSADLVRRAKRLAGVGQ